MTFGFVQSAAAKAAGPTLIADGARGSDSVIPFSMAALVPRDCRVRQAEVGAVLIASEAREEMYSCPTPTTPSRCVHPALGPVRSTGGGANASLLVVWRSRWWFNYAETMTRVVSHAVHLAHSKQPVHFFFPPVQGASSWPPPFYSRLFKAFGSVHWTARTLRAHSFQAVWTCCVNGGPSGDPHYVASGHHVLQRKTLGTFNLTLRRTVDEFDNETAYETAVLALGVRHSRRRQMLFVNRTGPRQISNLPSLLESCSALPGLSCRAIDFGAISYRTAVTTLNSHTDVLVGMHGADLANSYFLADGAVVIEVFGVAFGTQPTYGTAHFSLLNLTGVVHQRIMTAETQPACVSSARVACSRAGILSNQQRIGCFLPRVIDCAVSVKWDALLALLRRSWRGSGRGSGHEATHGA